MSKTTDLTKGKILPVIFSFYIPLLLTNTLQQIYTVADTAIVGKGLGDDKLAAVGVMSSISFLLFGFAMGLSNGFSVIIAQKFGAKEEKELKLSIAAVIKLMSFFAVVLTAVSVFLLRPLLNLMQTHESIINDSLKYGYIIFGCLATTLSYNMCSAILRALGDSKTPFIAIITSSVINICLDCLFIFGFKTGVEGAAAATVISQVISTLICLRRLWTIEEIKPSREDFSNASKLFWPLIVNGIPMALMNSITAIGCVVLQYFVNGLGVAYASAYSTCSRFVNLFMQPACTAGYAMSAFTSQNYGAGEYERIKSGLKVCAGIAFISYLIFGTFMVAFPKLLAGIMLNGDDSINLAAQYLPISGAMLFAVDLLFVFRSGVQAMGHPVIPMISGILEMVMRVAVVFLLIDSFGFRATSFAEVSAWTAALVLNSTAFVIFLHSAIRKNTVVNAVV